MTFVIIFMPRKPKNQLTIEDDDDSKSVSSLSDHEESVNESTDSDSDSDTGSVSDHETASADKKSTSKTESKTESNKSKSKSKTTNKDFDLVEEFEKFNDKIKLLNETQETYKELSDNVKNMSKEYKDKLTDLKKSYRELQININKEFKTLNKGKRKTNPNKKKGGITKPSHVPLAITKFLGLEPDIEIARSAITSKCYDEFKKRNMNMGNRKYKFDKESAKAFSMKKNDEFTIQEFQTMLAAVYNSDPRTKSKKASL